MNPDYFWVGASEIAGRDDEARHFVQILTWVKKKERKPAVIGRGLPQRNQRAEPHPRRAILATCEYPAELKGWLPRQHQGSPVRAESTNALPTMLRLLGCATQLQ